MSIVDGSLFLAKWALGTIHACATTYCGTFPVRSPGDGVAHIKCFGIAQDGSMSSVVLPITCGVFGAAIAASKVLARRVQRDDGLFAQ